MSALQRLRARFSRSNRPRGFASFDGLTSLLGVAALGVATLSGVFFAPPAEPSDDAAFLSGGTIYFTTDSGDFTFSKGDYPGLRAVRVRVQAGGAGADGVGSTGSGQTTASPGGGGGGYAEALIPVDQMGTDVNVVVGEGGPAGRTSGSNSSFGTLAEAEGGHPGGPAITSGGNNTMEGGRGGAGLTGDLLIGGDPGGPAVWVGSGSNQAIGGNGGGSVLGGGGRGHRSVSSQPASTPPSGYGAGAGGRANRENQSAQPGQAGADGVVIVELLY